MLDAGKEKNRFWILDKIQLAAYLIKGTRECALHDALVFPVCESILARIVEKDRPWLCPEECLGGH